jgi:hypothetical protein
LPKPWLLTESGSGQQEFIVRASEITQSQSTEVEVALEWAKRTSVGSELPKPPYLPNQDRRRETREALSTLLA